MQADTIYSTLNEFIAREILKQPGRTIPKDEALISSGLIDSFSLVDLALFIERAFSVRIDDTELNANVFDTLEALVAIILERRAALE